MRGIRTPVQSPQHRAAHRLVLRSCTATARRRHAPCLRQWHAPLERPAPDRWRQWPDEGCNWWSAMAIRGDQRRRSHLELKHHTQTQSDALRCTQRRSHLELERVERLDDGEILQVLRLGEGALAEQVRQPPADQFEDRAAVGGHSGHLMEEAIKGHQRQSRAIRGNQWEGIWGTESNV